MTMTQPTGLLSKGTTLSVKTREGGTFVVLEGLQSTPEMGGYPEKVDVTTLADSMKRYIPGIKDAGDLAFKFLYDNSSENTAYRKLVALEKSGEIAEFKVTYPDNTAHTFNAGVNVKIAGAEVNGALTFTANLTVNTEITVTNA